MEDAVGDVLLLKLEVDAVVDADDNDLVEVLSTSFCFVVVFFVLIFSCTVLYSFLVD